MNISENKQHDLLLAITSLLFIIFSSGLASPAESAAETTIITPT